MPRGPKTTLLLQRRTEALASDQSVSELWSDLRRISGLLAETNSVQNQVVELYDKTTDISTHVFQIDRQRGLTISSEDRFRDEITNIFYDVMFPGNPSNAGRHWEIHLRQRIEIG